MNELKIETTKRSDCELVFKIVIPEDRVRKEIETTYAEMEKKVSLPGFRKGKVPSNLVRERFKSECRETVLNALVPEAISRAIEREGVKPVSPARVSHLDFDFAKKGAINLEVMVEVLPEFEVKDYKKIKIKREVKAIKDSDVDEALKQLQERNAYLVPSENGVVENESYVLIDYQGLDDGKQIKELTEENLLVTPQSPKILSEFSRALLGMKKGEEKEVEIVLPDNYPIKDLAGKKILFRIKVKEIKKKMLPEVDDSFAKGFGVETLAELRQRLRESLIKLEEHRADEAMKEQIIEKLIENNPIPVPNYLVEDQLDQLLMRTRSYLQARGLTPEDIGVNDEILRKKYRYLAEKEVRSAIIFSKIAEKENIRIDPSEIEKEIQEAVESRQEREEEIRKYLYQNMDRIESRLKENKIFDFLVKNAKIQNEVKE